MLTITPAGRRRLVTVCVSLLLGITCAAAVTAALGDTFSIVTPARIMPVGDSITRGTGSGWGEGFRLPLVQRMIVGRYTSDFVGAANHGPPWLYDRNHDGFGGYGIDDITNRIAADLNTHRPDYVLLMIGSNDIQWEWHLDTAPDRLSALIDLITQTRPTANVLVASITPLTDPVMDANARLYNAAIPGIVQAKADAGKRVSFVDMYPVLTVNDLVDNVHPNDAGYAKLAAAWADAVARVRPAPPAASARNCPCSIWGAGDTPGTPQVTTTTAAEVGVKFRTEKAGFITAVRFYKGADNAGPHEARLWKAISDGSTYTTSSTTMTGTLLANGTVTSGASSGWQEVVFAAPVPVQAHTLYFATYYAPFGRYAADVGYFRDREIVNSPLRLPSQGSIDGNGFIRAGSPGLPQPSPQGDTNYWVDVVFVPASPVATTVTATAVSASQINLSWSAVTNATGYRVERSPDSTTWSALGTVASGVTSYSDTGLAAATTYYYRIIAISNGTESAPSASASATTLGDATPPTTPTGLKAASAKGKVNLSWTGSTDAGGSGLAGYRVWRSTSGTAGVFALIGTTAATSTSYTDGSVTGNTDYWYRVTAFDGRGNQSQPSNTVAARPK